MSKKYKKSIDKYNTIIKLLNDNEYLTLKEISKISGFTLPTISRLLKDNGYKKHDMKKTDNIMKKYGVINNEISNN